jgi:hypothetical protein
MASIGFSLSRSRWYFHHESDSIFRAFGEVIGSAKASYTTEAGYPALPWSRQTWFPIPAATLRSLPRRWGLNLSYINGKLNGVPDRGNFSGLSLTNLMPNAAGLYRLDVSNPVGLVSSRNARLTIYSVPRLSLSHRTAGCCREPTFSSRSSLTLRRP